MKVHSSMHSLITYLDEEIFDYIKKHIGEPKTTLQVVNNIPIHNVDSIINKENIVKLIDLFPSSSTQSYLYDKEVISESAMNRLFFFPDYDIYYCQYYIEGLRGIKEYVVSSSKEKIESFIDFLDEFNQKREQNYVDTYTDTSTGSTIESSKITRAVTKDDVFMDPNIKNEIFRSIDTFFTDDGEFYDTYNLPYKRGILLYGDPGNGKTTLAKSIASTVTRKVIYYQITEFTNSEAIKRTFKDASHFAPCVLIIEDIDSMPKDARSTFLNTLDGATSSEGVFLLGTTNYPDRVDKALINRAGRFDQTYKITDPTRELREAFLNHTKMDGFLSQDEIKKVAEKTEGFSLAQLNELYTKSAMNWHYDQSSNIDAIIDNMKKMNKKKKKDAWDETDASVGFGTD